jgi:hypothetical protein
MAQCIKTWGQLSFALFVLVFIAAGTGLNVLGTYWNQYDIKHGDITGATYNIIGNVMNVFASFMAIFIMLPAFADKPVAAGVLSGLILLGIVADLYITFFGESSTTGDAFSYSVVALNAIPRFVAVLLGYGICSIPDALDALKVLGGRRRIR